MYRITEVVKNLLIINILMFIGTNIVMGDSRVILAVFYPPSDFFQPYQLVTHMFMHANLTHLLFNMFALFIFGPPLEAMMGPKRFLFYYLFTGFGALFLYFLVKYLEISMGSYSAPELEKLYNTPMLGASGAVFGLLAGYALYFPNNILQLIFPPIALRAKYFVLIYAVAELFLGLGRFNTGIAHFAHLGGALFGLLLVLYWRRYGARW
jgi:membrane associated rhomboid family serine protease